MTTPALLYRLFQVYIQTMLLNAWAHLHKKVETIKNNSGLGLEHTWRRQYYIHTTIVTNAISKWY